MMEQTSYYSPPSRNQPDVAGKYVCPFLSSIEFPIVHGPCIFWRRCLPNVAHSCITTFRGAPSFSLGALAFNICSFFSRSFVLARRMTCTHIQNHFHSVLLPLLYSIFLQCLPISLEGFNVRGDLAINISFNLPSGVVSTAPTC
jgi:hypothetical protein